ncbi:MAG: PPC domain-containing protein [Anaerolineae bacterium]|nr:PPC domain-containing protein [Anaerolineae bacterium]
MMASARSAAVLLIFLLAACVATPTPPPSSRLLTPGQAIRERIAPGAPIQDWQFIARAGEQVMIGFLPADAAALRLELRAPDGTILPLDGSRAALPSDGVYAVRVRLVGQAETAYELRLILPERPTVPPSLTPTASATLTPPPTATLIPTVTLTPTDTPTFTPTFTPTLTPSPVHAALGALLGRIILGAPHDAEFLSPFDRHVFQFSGSAGRYATLRAAALNAVEAPPVDPRLTLYDALGNALATDDDSGGGVDALIRDVRLPRDGEYYVQVIGGGAGAYRLTLALADAPGGAPTLPAGAAFVTATPLPVRADARLREDALIAGSVAPEGLFSRFFIPAEAGDVLTIEVRAASGSPLRLALELYTPAGELMTRIPADSGAAIIPGIGVIETGLYPLFVTDTGDSGGAFTLIWRYESRARTATPSPQTILSAADPLPARAYLYYPFQGEAGQRVRISVEALPGSTGLDPVAALIDPTGAVIAEGDDSDGTLNPTIEAALALDGTYVLRVNAYGETAGDARVIVELLP